MDKSRSFRLVPGDERRLCVHHDDLLRKDVLLLFGLHDVLLLETLQREGFGAVRCQLNLKYHEKC